MDDPANAIIGGIVKAATATQFSWTEMVIYVKCNYVTQTIAVLKKSKSALI